jgi:tRNA pseudouridine55 synthase
MRAAPAKSPRRRVDGVLLLDKPSGLSSNAALQRAKRLFQAEKAGHTGTLDPLASGLLPLCFGEATKFAQALLDARKEYIATVRFGVATTTGDAEGEPIASGPAELARDDVEAMLPRFTGRILQVPPRHSALKHQGRAYYEYARAGVEIARRPREVDVIALEIVGWSPPAAVLRVECSKGTYIRALAEDLGQALGTCAHLSGLRRTASGAFVIGDGITLDALDALDVDARDALLRPIDAPLAAMPRLELAEGEATALLQGRGLTAATRAAGRYRAYCENRFIGIVAIEEGLARPLRMARND